MIRVVIKKQGTFTDQKKILKRVLQEGMVLIIERWHEKNLPQHFTVPGSFKYGYRSRMFEYNKRKNQQKGHWRPLVFTGDTEAMATGRIMVRAAGENARGVIRVPPYINKSNFGGAGNTMRDELVRITPEETEEMAGILDAYMTEKLNRIPEGEDLWEEGD